MADHGTSDRNDGHIKSQRREWSSHYSPSGIYNRLCQVRNCFLPALASRTDVCMPPTSHPKPFKCSIQPRSDQVVTLIQQADPGDYAFPIGSDGRFKK